jgi:ABC-type nitrate/sulfonate/bicarbonate transport system substrate-binding protein
MRASRLHPIARMSFHRLKGAPMRKLVILAFAAIVASGAPAAAQEKLRVSVPQRGLWDTGVSELGRRAGIFQKHGLDLDILFTSGGAESQQAVIGGSMDIATGVGVSGAIGAFAKGAPLRLIGSEMIGSPDLYWYVVPASPIRAVADIAGKSVGFSVTGSSSHAGLLEFARQNKLTVKPVSTGGMPATLTQVMTSQIDVGWAAVPFGIDGLDSGKIRLLARGYDVEALRGRTTRVNVTGLDMLAKRRDALERYMRAYRETIDWMYSDDPAVLRHYADYSGFPEQVVKRVREFIPKETMMPDRIMGMDEIVSDAIKQRFLAQPLTQEQIAEFVRIPAAP